MGDCLGEVSGRATLRSPARPSLMRCSRFFHFLKLLHFGKPLKAWGVSDCAGRTKATAGPARPFCAAAHFSEKKRHARQEKLITLQPEKIGKSVWPLG